MCEIFIGFHREAGHGILLLYLSSFSMDVNIRASLLLFTLLKVLLLVQALEDNNVEHQDLHNEACDFMVVSHAGTTKGMDPRNIYTVSKV